MGEETERACEPKNPQEFLDFKEVGISLRDKEFITMHNDIQHANCRCFMIPPEMLEK